VRPTQVAGCFEVRWALPREPLVSIVIPTAGGDRVVRGKTTNLVSHSVERIRSSSTYRNYEIVVVDNGDLRSEVRLSLERSASRRVTFGEPVFNISRKINLGAAHARGEFLLLLNDDIDLINADWIEALLEQAMKPGVGAVGAKLLYENDTTQHVGVVHHNGLPDHVRKHFPREDPGYRCSSSSVRNYLAVTGACMLTSAEAFGSVGGYDEAFRINYGDVDYCLKLRQRGMRTIYTPHAQLYHYESASRRAEVAQDEIDLFLRRWRAVTARDPYYNTEVLRAAPSDFSLNLHADRRDRRHVPA
jgi:GT2 family glycosyltransferase